MTKLTLCKNLDGETRAGCIQGQVVTESFNENIAHIIMELPSTVIGWKSISRHTVKKSGVMKTKLTRCGQQSRFNHQHVFLVGPQNIISRRIELETCLLYGTMGYAK